MPATAISGTVTLAGIVALTVGLAAGVQPADAICTPAFEWRGGDYDGVAMVRTPPAGGELTTRALVPGCNDTGGPKAEPTPVAVRRVGGIAPAVALQQADPKNELLYLRRGHFADLTDHPAYRYIAHSAPISPTARCASRTRTLGGTVVGAPFPGNASLVLRTKSAPWLRGIIHSGIVFARYRPSTRVRLGQVGGLPYVAAGDRVEADVNICGVPGGTSRQLLIRELRPLRVR